jgi:hypothetical protein
MKAMRTRELPLDWAFSPALDLEMKQYTLLGYLQRVRRRFSEHKLYPHLEELRLHIEELMLLRDRMKQMESAIPGELLGFDPRTGEAVNETGLKDPYLGIVDEVIALALPTLRGTLAEGSELRNEIAGRIHFAPVGVMPLRAQEGWLLLHAPAEIRVYGYELSLLRAAEETIEIGRMRTRYITTYTTGLRNTHERIKLDLLQAYRSIPNPAVFAFVTDLSLPYVETFMPLAKQLVYEVVARTDQ